MEGGAVTDNQVDDMIYDEEYGLGDYDDDHAILAQIMIKPPAAASGTQPAANTRSSTTAPVTSG